MVNESVKLFLRPSSTIQVQVHRQSRFHLGRKGETYLLGEISKRLVDLASITEQGYTYPLTVTGESSGSIRITLSVEQTISSLAELGLASAAADLDRADHALDRLNKPSNTSGLLQSVSAAVGDAQSVDAAVQQVTRATGTEILGSALQFLDVLVQVVDGFADVRVEILLLRVLTRWYLQVHPIFRLSWTLLSTVYKTLKAQAVEDEAMRDLAIDLRDMLGYARRCTNVKKIDGTTDILVEVGRLVSDGAIIIDERMRHGFIGRTVTSMYRDTQKRIQDCRDRLSKLQGKFSVSLQIGIHDTINQIGDKVDLADIRSLPVVSSAAYDGRNLCMEGTRREIIDEVMTWASSPSDKEPSIFWLHAMAGEGKTSIATSVAHALHDKKILGGSFFFSRDYAECTRVDNVFVTLVSQLVDHMPEFTPFVAHVLQGQRSEIISSAHNQFHLLMKKVFTYVAKEPVVFVLDALDECISGRDHRELLLSCLTAREGLPSSCRFFLTSRPEDDIGSQLETLDNTVLHSESLRSFTGTTIDADIQMFLQTSLQRVAAHSRKIRNLKQANWPGPERQQMMLKQTSGLFIWAATAIRFLEDTYVADPEKQLQIILNGSSSYQLSMGSRTPSDYLDQLYIKVLDHAYPGCMTSNDHDILGAIVLMQEPLSAISIAQLLHISVQDENSDAAYYNVVYEAIWRLQSVLTAPTHIENAATPIHVLHPSFPDFMTVEERCSEKYYINKSEHHVKLARGCLQVMQDFLQFNICRIKDILKVNAEIEYLDLSIQTYIPECLKYACIFWAEHVVKASASEYEQLKSQIKDFLQNHLLNWLEVLSLLKSLQSGFLSLQVIADWAQPKNNDDFKQLLTEAMRFLTTFWQPMEASALHVHISLAQYIPTKSVLAKYLHGFKCHGIHVTTGLAQFWPQYHAVLTGHTSVVKTVVYSPDGAYIASGSWDNTIRIWDARTGALVGEPLQGHTYSIEIVAFSPNGAYIASGSSDSTMRIWDAKTGAPVGQPLKHDSSVHVVVFSPDGAYIASGSRDKTIRIWKVETRELVGQAFEGHKDGVCAVTFSLDGAYILSGSRDNTIRLWEAQTGVLVSEPLEGHAWLAFSPNGAYVVSGAYDKTAKIWDVKTGIAVGEPLEGHTGPIQTVAFSPDGMYIASGSWDKTIRLWDARTGASVGEPFQGHTNLVNTVAFSPDGIYIASGSSDDTVRIWEAKTRSPVAKPFEGHTSSVSSVTFSHDGAYIAFGSRDNLIRVWEVKTGAPVGKPLEGHQDEVCAVAFSPDGAYIASGSHDKTIRIWNAKTGVSVGKPFEGHIDAVNTVAFSPDGVYIASGSRDSTVRVWEAQTGALVHEPLQGHTHWVNVVVFSPDGAHIATGSWDFTIRIWDTKTGAQVSKPLEYGPFSIETLVYSSDGVYIASWSSFDQNIKIWDVKTCRMLFKCTQLSILKGVNSLVQAASEYKCWNKNAELSGCWFRDIQDGWVMGPNSQRVCWIPLDSLSGPFEICGFCMVCFPSQGMPIILDVSECFHVS
ncbi:WD40 repeat-like protein [Artomyces pyxidatus]|uniref:WD40 repeat-like protein n=1 Tax=Artomyces pyxidatus TaxID=48021 RepID=A0ACB8STR8_9AGAM|nr:WD40 repeat-like protein [Artomyces pyxidatus]